MRLGVLKGHNRTHTWAWNGTNNGGAKLQPGTYRIKVVSVYYGQKVVSDWRTAVLKRKPSSGGGGGAGGSGNGPYYTAPGEVYRVAGSDPYGLDADNDGLGCE